MTARRSRDGKRNREPGITEALALRGRKVEELRELATRHLSIDAATRTATQLRQLLSSALKSNSALSRELAESPIALKPSFYLLSVQLTSDSAVLTAEVRRRIRVFFDSVNGRLTKDSRTPALKEFSVVSASQPVHGVIELQLTWHHIIRYFSTEGRFDHVYALKPGFVFIDTNSAKALICCHSKGERDSIIDAIEEHLPIKLSPMQLDRALLDEIGPFEKVQGATWSKANPGPDETEEVSYSDSKLSSKKSAAAAENDPQRSRDHSFYRIHLGAIEESGVGVTSQTAKLWVPAETAVENIRDFGLALLEKFAGTIKKLKRERKDDAVFRLLGLENSSAFRSVEGNELRDGISELLRELFQMFLSGETERTYRPPDVFLTRGVPEWFNPARIKLEDEENNSTRFWTSQTGNQLVRFRRDFGVWSASSYDGTEELDLTAMSHPLMGRLVEVQSPPLQTYLSPTSKLHSLLMEGIKRLASEYPKLQKCRALPFWIDSGRLAFDLAKARSEEFSESLHQQIDLAKVRNFRVALTKQLSGSETERLTEVLFALKEKCVHMTAENCEHCLDHRKFLCLRSLIARFMSDSVLQIHSSIELSDLEGTMSFDGRDARVWVFSKVGPKRSTFTLRNTNGAVLFSQIAFQIEKSGFDCVAVLTPSIVSQDLRNRINFLALAAGKRYVIFDRPLLEKLLAHFEEQTQIDGKDPLKVYRASRSLKNKGSDFEAAGRLA